MRGFGSEQQLATLGHGGLETGLGSTVCSRCHVDLILSAEGDDADLVAELGQARVPVRDSDLPAGWISIDSRSGSPMPSLAFARQLLPEAHLVCADSVNRWAQRVLEGILSGVPEARPWRLHLWPHYGVVAPRTVGARRAFGTHVLGRRPSVATESQADPAGRVLASAGLNRCRWIREALVERLKERRRHLLRTLRDSTDPWGPDESLVQVVLTSPDRGWVSIAPAPRPMELHHSIWPWPGGSIPVAEDRAAPSRAFAKLTEALSRLGRGMGPGDVCVDLGASPGGWSYVALSRGARVMAVDRSPLREDLMRDPRLEFVRGDAFGFRPERPVDWLVCDVIAAPERSAAMLLEWLERSETRWFVVTLKLKGEADRAKLDGVRRDLARWADPLFLLRLNANKGEVTAFGCRRGAGASG
jgi:23S rRNA (cytidine2498-2'-O)-methyltransferase